MAKTETKIIDITDMTDAALDAFLASYCEDPADAPTVDHLSSEERRQIVVASGGDPMDPVTNYWIYGV